MAAGYATKYLFMRHGKQPDSSIGVHFTMRLLGLFVIPLWTLESTR